jgi:hypothetical protein
MSKKINEQIYKMREQGVDSTIFSDVVQSEFETYDAHPEDVIWDDDTLFDDDSGKYYSANLRRKKYNDFRNVGERHY